MLGEPGRVMPPVSRGFRGRRSEHVEAGRVPPGQGHKQHQEMLDWLGLDNTTAFDPNAVTIDQLEEEVALNGASR